MFKTIIIFGGFIISFVLCGCDSHTTIAGSSRNCISGVVKDAQTGLPIDSAYVSAYYDNDDEEWGYAHSDGKYITCFPGQTPSDTRVTCSKDGYQLLDTVIHINKGYGKIYELEILLESE